MAAWASGAGVDEAVHVLDILLWLLPPPPAPPPPMSPFLHHINCHWLMSCCAPDRHSGVIACGGGGGHRPPHRPSPPPIILAAHIPPDDFWDDYANYVPVHSQRRDLIVIQDCRILEGFSAVWKDSGGLGPIWEDDQGFLERFSRDS